MVDASTNILHSPTYSERACTPDAERTPVNSYISCVLSFTRMLLVFSIFN
jgi:hypothetical protein